jgi:hypothetical protein
MYLSTDIHTHEPITAALSKQDAGFIWVQAGSIFSAKLSAAEAQQLIAEVQRELAVVEAAARGAPA